MSDLRLDDVGTVIAQMQPHIAAIEASAKQVAAVLRACAENGMADDEIAVQAALSIEVVTRVLSSDPLLKLPCIYPSGSTQTQSELSRFTAPLAYANPQWES